MNLGLVGASPEQYFRVYETFGARLQPKLLLVGVYVQNDFWDAGMFDLWLREGVGNNYMVWRNFGRPLRVPSACATRSRPPRVSFEATRTRSFDRATCTTC